MSPRRRRGRDPGPGIRRDPLTASSRRRWPRAGDVRRLPAGGRPGGAAARAGRDPAGHRQGPRLPPLAAAARRVVGGDAVGRQAGGGDVAGAAGPRQRGRAPGGSADAQGARLAAAAADRRHLLRRPADDDPGDGLARRRPRDPAAERGVARTRPGEAGPGIGIVVLRAEPRRRHGRQLQLPVRAAGPPRGGAGGRAGAAGDVGSRPAVLDRLRQRRRLVGLRAGQHRRLGQHDLRRHRQHLDHGGARGGARRPRRPRERAVLRRRVEPAAPGAGARLARQTILGDAEPRNGRRDLALLLPLRPRAGRPVHGPPLHRRQRLVPRGGEDVHRHPGPARQVRRQPHRGFSRRHELRAPFSREGPPAGDRRQEPPRPRRRLEPPRP